METVKKWYLSRGVWLGIVTCLIGSTEVIAEAVRNGDLTPAGLLIAILGVLKVIERVVRSDSSQITL